MKPCIKFIPILLMILLFQRSAGQALYPITLDQKINNATLIIEGKVIDKYSFWNEAHTMIYTSNKVEVYKTFKGSTNAATIEIMTVGGVVGYESVEASDLLTLDKNNIGLFFCTPTAQKIQAPLTGVELMDVYSSAQGFIAYDVRKKTASAPFNQYKNIQTDLYQPLQSKLGRTYTTNNASFDIDQQILVPNLINAPVITSFSPSTVYAGAILNPANNVLTITGSGFGTPTGSARLEFDDNNNGSGGTAYSLSATDDQIISWIDTEIKVKVPARAGTGNFSVVIADGITSVTSASPITVTFSTMTVTLGGATTEYNLMNTNGSGGYTFLFSNSTAGRGVDLTTSSIKTTFLRAMNTWKELVGVRLIEGAGTSIQAITGDNNNVVVMDNDNNAVGPLPSGVLAVCYSYGSRCTPSTFAQKTEIDIIIRNTGVSLGSTLFTEGPCPPLSSGTSYYDLETVILHELGHALGLAHINDAYESVSGAGYVNPGKLMHYAVVNTAKRVSPDYSAKFGAAYCVATNGNDYRNCGLFSSEMTLLSTTTESKDDCPGTFPTTSTPNNALISFDLVHATTNKNSDPSYRQVRTSSGTSLTNNAYYPIKTGASGNLSITISGYALSPTTPTTCTSFNTGSETIPMIGVELSVYQMSTCPAGQNFPTPINYQTFNANGAITNVTGLVANTNYLLMFDGLENTKATFDITLTGSALPVKLKSFNGSSEKAFNKLIWQTEAYENIRSVYMERSFDGLHFENLALINTNGQFVSGAFNDYHPMPGNNFYRLAIKNNDGSIEYSTIVSIKRIETVFIKAFPNPAKDLIYLEMMAEQSGNYQVRLLNPIGQWVYQKIIQVNGKYISETLPTHSYGKGVYQLTITNGKGVTIKTIPITIL